MSASELVKAYTAYRTKREKIKARQRRELEKELQPEAISIGAAFVREQEKGRSVVEIAGSLGLKNRTFLYAMKRVYLASEGSTEATETLEPTPASTSTENAPEYTFDKGLNKAIVSITDTQELFELELDDKGRVIRTPDKWASHSKEKRALYKQIVQEINNATG